MRKEKYYDIEMEIIRFDNEDVITESNPETPSDEVGETPPDDGDF